MADPRSGHVDAPRTTPPEEIVRHAIMASLSRTERDTGYTHDDFDAAHAALDVLLAERQRLEDENEAQLREHAREVEALWVERQQLVEALEARAALAAVREPSQDRETPAMWTCGGCGRERPPVPAASREEGNTP